MRSTLIAFAIFAGLYLGSHARAEAALRVCDATQQPAAVAIAVLQPSASGTQSTSEGWFQIDAQKCTRVIDTPLNAGARYYLYAKSTTMVWSGNPKRGTKDAEFCTNFSSRFFYTDRPASLCIGDDEQMQWFINEAVSTPDWTINLYSP